MTDNPDASPPEAPVLNLPASVRARYRIEAELGRGSMGVVYRAYDQRLDRLVALKELYPAVSKPEDREKHEARFLREARLAARLSHPNIVTVYDVLQEEGRWFIVMELLEGRSMRQILRERGRIPPEMAREWMWQTARALHAAHRAGIVHRDIKPENLMVQPDGQVKIMDFGIALASDSPRLTRRGGTMGTPAYLAPELLRGASADVRTDLFSLGVVFFELLTGMNPYTGGTVSQVLHRIATSPPPPIRSQAPEVWMDLGLVVDRLLTYDPSARHPTAAALAFDLENTASDSRSIYDALLEEPGGEPDPNEPDDRTVFSPRDADDPRTLVSSQAQPVVPPPQAEELYFPAIPPRDPPPPLFSGRGFWVGAMVVLGLLAAAGIRIATLPRQPETVAVTAPASTARDSGSRPAPTAPGSSQTGTGVAPVAPAPPGSLSSGTGTALAAVPIAPGQPLDQASPALARPTPIPSAVDLEAQQRVASVQACSQERTPQAKMGCLEATVPAMPRGVEMPAEARKLITSLLDQDAVKERALALAPVVLSRRQLIQKMRGWLSSPDVSRRWAAADMLAKLGQPVPEAELRRMDLRDPSCPVRRDAAMYFIDHPTWAARPDLEKALANSTSEGVEKTTGVKSIFKKTQRVEIQHCDHEALKQALKALGS